MSRAMENMYDPGKIIAIMPQYRATVRVLSFCNDIGTMGGSLIYTLTRRASVYYIRMVYG